MTENMDRESSARLNLGDGVAETLRQAGMLAPATVITHCVTVVQTFTEDEFGNKRYDIHRVYPFGELDPSTERGILADAIEDSRSQRRRRTAS